MHTKGREKIFRYAGASDELRFALARPGKREPRQIFSDVRKRSVLVAVVEVIGAGRGDLPLPGRIGTRPDCVEAIGIGVWQRLEQNILHHAEDRRICTDPERERQDNDQSEPGRFAKLSKSKLKIAHIILRAARLSDRRVWRGGAVAARQAERRWQELRR